MRMLSRDALERHQVWLYLLAVVLGLVTGTVFDELGQATEVLVWPVLAVLLYATFTQMPLGAIPAAFTDVRFLAAALVGNFVLIPLVVWGLIQPVGDDQVLRLGLLLVLLVPCTDWFITFTQLGRGDATRATAFTPISLVLQLLLLPLYLWLLVDVDLSTVFAPADVWPAFLVLLAPLALAALTTSWARKSPQRQSAVDHLGWGPVPLLAVVIFLVATGHVTEVRENLHLLPVVVGVAVAFLAVALVLAKLLAVAARLPAGQGRALAFSLGTRNSFIVLPFALSLPAGWEAVAIVVVMQSLVELSGMVFYLWFVPRTLFPDNRRTPASTSPVTTT